MVKDNLTVPLPKSLVNEKVEVAADKSSTTVMMQVITADEFAGQGGSYIYDPVTGKRTREPDELPDK